MMKYNQISSHSRQNQICDDRGVISAILNQMYHSLYGDIAINNAAMHSSFFTYKNDISKLMSTEYWII